MYPLLLCSFVSLVVIIERAIFWVREERRKDQRLVDKILTLAERGNYQKAIEFGAGCGDYVAKVLLC